MLSTCLFHQRQKQCHILWTHTRKAVHHIFLLKQQLSYESGSNVCLCQRQIPHTVVLAQWKLNCQNKKWLWRQHPYLLVTTVITSWPWLIIDGMCFLVVTWVHLSFVKFRAIREGQVTSVYDKFFETFSVTSACTSKWNSSLLLLFTCRKNFQFLGRGLPLTTFICLPCPPFDLVTDLLLCKCSCCRLNALYLTYVKYNPQSPSSSIAWNRFIFVVWQLRLKLHHLTLQQCSEDDFRMLQCTCRILWGYQI